MQWFSSALYLAGGLAAAAATIGTFVAHPCDGRRRAVAVLLATGLLLAGSMFISAPVPASAATADAPTWAWSRNLTAAGTLLLLAHLAALLAVDRLGSIRLLRLCLDTVATGCLWFAVFFRLQVISLSPESGSATVFDAVLPALYGSLGMLVIFGAAAAVTLVSWRSLRDTERLELVAVCLVASGVVVWQLLPAFSALLGPWVHSAAAVLYLGASLLVILAGLTRLRFRDRNVHGAMVQRISPWPGVALTSFVFAAVLLVGSQAITLQRDSGTGIIYVAVLTLAAVCMVARTILTALEAERLERLVSVDETTGCGNLAALHAALDELGADTSHVGHTPAIAVVHIDRFHQIQQGASPEHVDRVLQEVTRVLMRDARVSGLYRTDVDEFVALVTAHRASGTVDAAQALGRAIAENEALPGVTASIGVASASRHRECGAQLLNDARVAAVWAQYDGGGRTVLFDERVANAVGAIQAVGADLDGRQADVVRALYLLVDALGVDSARHARRVATLCSMVAIELGFDEPHVGRLRLAATLHEVGKAVRLAENSTAGMSHQSNRIENTEYLSLGEKLIESLGLAEVGSWVGAHQAHWDGSGTPDGLAGELIPFEARIIAVADAFDRLTAGDPSRRPMSEAAALQEIDLGIGTRFDSTVAELFIRVVATTSAMRRPDEWTAA